MRKAPNIGDANKCLTYRASVNTDDVYELILKYIEAITQGRFDKRKIKQKSFVCFTYRVAA